MHNYIDTSLWTTYSELIRGAVFGPNMIPDDVKEELLPPSAYPLTYLLTAPRDDHYECADNNLEPCVWITKEAADL